MEPLKHLTIHFADGMLAINGTPYVHDDPTIKELGSTYHALQFDYDKNAGEIEFQPINGYRPINAPVQGLQSVQHIIDHVKAIYDEVVAYVQAADEASDG